MSDSNIVSAVAAGNAPQPGAEAAQDSNYDEVLEIAEEDADSGEEVVAQESAEDKIDAAQKAGDISKSQAQELKKKLKLKVDGEEFEEELDFNDEEGLKKHLQKSKAFDKRVREFSGYQSQVESLLEQLQKDPDSVLEKMGIDLDKRAEERLARKIEEMKKSPEQLEKEKMSKELEDLRQEKKKIEEAKQKAEQEQLRQKHAQEFESDLISALEDQKSILPKKNAWVLQRVAQTMMLAIQNGYEGVKVKDVIPLVEKQWKEELASYFDGSPEDMIEMLVGKNNLDRYRKKKMGTRKPTVTAKQAAQDTGAKKSQEDEDSPRPKKKFRDFFTND